MLPSKHNQTQLLLLLLDSTTGIKALNEGISFRGMVFIPQVQSRDLQNKCQDTCSTSVNCHVFISSMIKFDLFNCIVLYLSYAVLVLSFYTDV